MGVNLTNLFYLVTIVTFILALRYLSSPAHARRGNQIGAVGMLVAIAVTFAHKGAFTWVIGFVAVVLASANVVGGFVVTDRMLEMFKKREPAKRKDAPPS